MKINNPINLAGGCITGFLAGGLLLAEGNLLSAHVVPQDMPGLSAGLMAGFALAGIGAFALLLKKFLTLKTQKLLVYYLLSILISAAAALSAFYVLFSLTAGWLQSIVLSGFFESSVGALVCWHLFFLAFAFLTGVFVFTFAKLTKGKAAYIQYISREVKQIEEEGFGRKLKVTGNDEISHICTSINHLSEKLLEKQEREQQIEQQKNQLITNVSHDLRSPLTSIMGYVKLLKQEGASDPEAFKEYIGVVDRRLQGLNNMVNELFELTKLNERDAALHLEPMDLVLLLKHLAWENELLFRQHDLKLKQHFTKEAFAMELDSGKIARAIQNLFDNAGKYAKEKSEVLFSVQTEEHILTIRMTNEVQEGSTLQTDQLFERFYKSDSSRSNTESSGLGLAIAKRIIELHGGEITAEMHGNILCFSIRFASSGS